MNSHETAMNIMKECAERTLEDLRESEVNPSNIIERNRQMTALARDVLEKGNCGCGPKTILPTPANRFAERRS